MYRFKRYDVLSRHNTMIIIKTPIPKANSDSRLIPTLIPDIVDEVAIAVMHQMIIT